MPPGDAVTRYPVIPEPGLAGGVQATDAEALPGLATTPVGTVAAGVGKKERGARPGPPPTPVGPVGGGGRRRPLGPPLAATKICPSPEGGVLKVATPDTAA